MNICDIPGQVEALKHCLACLSDPKQTPPASQVLVLWWIPLLLPQVILQEPQVDQFDHRPVVTAVESVKINHSKFIQMKQDLNTGRNACNISR